MPSTCRDLDKPACRNVGLAARVITPGRQGAVGAGYACVADGDAVVITTGDSQKSSGRYVPLTVAIVAPSSQRSVKVAALADTEAMENASGDCLELPLRNGGLSDEVVAPSGQSAILPNPDAVVMARRDGDESGVGDVEFPVRVVARAKHDLSRSLCAERANDGK
jgi:hypothetical protein